MKTRFILIEFLRIEKEGGPYWGEKHVEVGDSVLLGVEFLSL